MPEISQVTVDEELERTFHELKAKWKAQTRFLSSTTQIIHNENYQYIIGLGPSVIPLLLKDLAETHNFWFWALMAISRENPVPEESSGNTGKMVATWLDWGRRKGYV
jgi:hypothetical protein